MQKPTSCDQGYDNQKKTIMKYKEFPTLNIALFLAIAGVFNSCSRDAAVPRSFHEWYFPHGICTYDKLLLISLLLLL
jgi:hypothetical protein